MQNPEKHHSEEIEAPLRKAIEEFSRTHEADFADWIADYPVEDGYSKSAKQDAVFLIVLRFFQWISQQGYQAKFTHTALRAARRKKMIIRYLLVFAASLIVFLMLWTESNDPLLPFMGKLSSAVLIITMQGILLFFASKYTEKYRWSDAATLIAMVAAFGVPNLIFWLLR